MKSAAIIVGTRPEAIKLAPVVLEMRRRDLPCTIITTGQHQQLMVVGLGAFGLEPDESLWYHPDMEPNLEAHLSEIVQRLGAELRLREPALVVVQGDTTSAFAGALAGWYAGIPVAHVEAGLRTYNKEPFPEEGHRQMIARIAAVNFCPREEDRQCLLDEVGRAPRTFVTGNTVVDALNLVYGKASYPRVPGAKTALITMHRRENWGKRSEILQVKRLLEEAGFNVEYVGHPSVNLPALMPLPYPEFVAMLAASDVVLTDSGGVTEEAVTLGVPLIIMRDVTERDAALESPMVDLLPLSRPLLVADVAISMANDPQGRAKALKHVGIFGDGKAAGRIVDALAGYLVEP